MPDDYFHDILFFQARVLEPFVASMGWKEVFVLHTYLVIQASPVHPQLAVMLERECTHLSKRDLMLAALSVRKNDKAISEEDLCDVVDLRSGVRYS